MEELATLIRRYSEPIEPITTGIPAHTEILPGIRAVLFDIYGTLFVSASGDIGLTSEEGRSEAMREVLRTVGAPTKLVLREDLGPRFRDAILTAQERRREEGAEVPEVDIRKVWAEYLAEVSPTWGVNLKKEIRDWIAVAYECRVNPVWPMPNLADTLRDLRDQRMPLGIVSNAQFFTPLLFEAFLGSDVDHLGFIDDLCAWSWRCLEAKPSPRIFAKVIPGLEALRIEPAEVLYLGNDVRNDILGAQTAGFRTALFAGDRRSLRLRTDDASCSGVAPDRILTDLAQIFDILGEQPA